MDAFLDYLGFYRSDVPKEKSSLFRAVSEQLFLTQTHHLRLKESCDEYIKNNSDMFNQETDSQTEIKALSLMYKLDFVVYYDTGEQPLRIETGSSKTVFLACTNGKHYDCIYSKSVLPELAFCQSLVYEILYKDVFDLGSDVDLAVEKMLHDRVYSKQRRNNIFCQLFKENCRIDTEDFNSSKESVSNTFQDTRLNIRDALAQGIPPFPYKVAKTLDPFIYRNVEFDIWNEKRKELQKKEQFIVPNLEAGVKCRVHFNKKVLIGHVQEILTDNENVSIYIEELCKRCIISSRELEVIPVPVQNDFDKAKITRSQKKIHQEQTSPSNCISRTHSSAQVNCSPVTAIDCDFNPTHTNFHFSKKSPSNVNSYKQRYVSSEKCNQGISNTVEVWSNLSTPPIPIPGKVALRCQQFGSPEFNESSWIDDSFKYLQSASFSPQQTFPISPCSNDSVIPVPSVPNSSPIEDCPMALYPISMYTVPGVYWVCPDGSNLPLSAGSFEEPTETKQILSEVPSVFNSPPLGLPPPWMSPPAAHFNTAMTPTTYVPSLDMNAYPPVISPPWSPVYPAASPVATYVLQGTEPALEN